MDEKTEYDRGTTISLSGSDITWEDVDNRTKKLGLTGRSRYAQHAFKKEMESNKIMTRKEIVLYSIVLLIFFALVLQILGVI